MERGAIKQEESTSVRVEFREASSDDLVIVTHMESAELPPDFELETVLDLGVGLFTVVRAEPMHRAAFAASGKLTLWLERKITPAAPDRIKHEQLFAPPTVQDTLPETASVDISEDEDLDLLLMIAEDWRQNEVIARTHHALVNQSLDRISRTMPGLTHARATLEHPLAGLDVDLDAIAHALDAAYFDGVAFANGDEDEVVNEVISGFALESAQGTLFYGRQDSRGALIELGVHVWEGVEELLVDLGILATLYGSERALFVSWCSESATSLEECETLRQTLAQG